MRKTVAAAAMAGSLIAGGALGIALFGPTSAIGQTTTTTTPDNPNNGGSFRSNEDPSHEGTEVPGREADENAGRGFGRCHHMGAGRSNEGAAHEGSESSGREADEGTGQAPTPQAPSTPAPSPGAPSV
jgi:hypothetical protein